MRVVFAIAMLSLLAACASSSRVATKHEGVIRTDGEYVARVEAMARKRGIEVVWINPPKVRPDTVSD
ncbi:MAG TPA: hypothetical protein VFG21_02870 [Xanthomonadaceae bacterium]|nr:hypothetical protein [Xanthomonadaceae bacterium]